jgi:hypothetical protein
MSGASSALNCDVRIFPVNPRLAKDGVVELPFLHSVGIELRYEGRAAIAGFYDSLYRNFAFKPEDAHVPTETSESGVGACSGGACVKSQAMNEAAVAP